MNRRTILCLCLLVLTLMAVASCGQDATNDQTKLGNLNMTKDNQSGPTRIWVTVTPPTASLPAVGAYDSRVATTWFDLYLDLVQTTPGFTPPVASRAFGYAGVTLYEAVVPGMPGYQSLAGQLNELPPLPQPRAGETYHWPTVANSALARITSYLFANTS